MSLIKDPIEAFLYIRRQEGWRSAFSLARQFLLLPFFEYHRLLVVRRSLKEPVDVPAPRVAVTIREATLDDLAILETIVPPLRVKRFAKKMQAGEICMVALQEQQVVGYCLGGFANTPSTEDAQLKLGPKEAYAWGGYVSPQCRRQGVWGAVHLALCRLQREKGYETCFGLVEMGNRASLGALQKIGFRETERLTLLRVLRWRMSWRAPLEDLTQGEP
jgi:ribosomal protein S18 acetylase RimI-like enzyme